MEQEKDYDVETGGKVSYEVRHGSVIEAEIARTKEIQHKVTFLSSLRKGEEWLDAKMGIELQGIDRVPEDERHPPSMWNIFLLWWSLNVHVGVIPLGVLGSEFGLDLKQTVGAGIVGSALGSLCTAWDGTMSPKVCFCKFGKRRLVGWRTQANQRSTARPSPNSRLSI